MSIEKSKFQDQLESVLKDKSKKSVQSVVEEKFELDEFQMRI
jgi:hypothetical protein